MMPARLCAALLGVASIAFAAAVFLGQELDRRSAILVTGAAGVLILSAALAGVRRLGRGYLLAFGAAFYAMVLLGILALLLDRELLYSIRLGLTAMLFASTVLALVSAFVAGRSKASMRRYRMNNYFD